MLVAEDNKVNQRLVTAILEKHPPAFDPEEVLARVEGDRDLLAELVEIFHAESPRLLTDLRRCVEANDPKGVEDAAHALKGSVTNFGGRAASAAALALEVMGRKGDLAGAQSRLAELEWEVDRLSRGLGRMREEARMPEETKR